MMGSLLLAAVSECQISVTARETPVYSRMPSGTQQAYDPFYYAHIIREMARSQWVLALANWNP